GRRGFERRATLPLRAPGGGRREAHSMSPTAQVTALGSITSMIVIASTRPNRQNRSTRSNRAGFIAICSPHGKQSRPLGRIVRAESGETCELLHTSNHHYFDGNNNGVLYQCRASPCLFSPHVALPAGFIAAVPSNAH